ncbi:MAG: hypothetical protein ACK5Y2_11395 [Bdellovibrionales bacterium]
MGLFSVATLFRMLLLLGPLTWVLAGSDAPPAPNWTDPTLVPQETTIKAAHVNELRALLNSRRAACGLPASTWTDDPVVMGVTPIKKVHIDELRMSAIQLAVGMSVMMNTGLPNLSFTDPSIVPRVTVIRATHIQEVRNIAAVSYCSSTCNWQISNSQTVTASMCSSPSLDPLASNYGPLSSCSSPADNGKVEIRCTDDSPGLDLQTTHTCACSNGPTPTPTPPPTPTPTPAPTPGPTPTPAPTPPPPCEDAQAYFAGQVVPCVPGTILMLPVCTCGDTIGQAATCKSDGSGWTIKYSNPVPMCW